MRYVHKKSVKHTGYHLGSPSIVGRAVELGWHILEDHIDRPGRLRSPSSV